MAKSLRSKWRRRCRAVKRERYGVKELARLKKTLGIDENTSGDAEMTEISEIATVVDAKTINESSANKEDEIAVVATDEAEKTVEQRNQREEMEVEGGRVFNKKTMRDQYGNYPVWMHQRKILKHKKGRAKTVKCTLRPGKRVTRRQKKAARQN